MNVIFRFLFRAPISGCVLGSPELESAHEPGPHGLAPRSVFLCAR
jgi:hypothetical protein